jgi:putative ABC transport system substrate-binding protein
MLPRSLWLGQRMQFDRTNRRHFITLLGGALAMRPVAAWGQQGERMRRIAVLTPLAASDSEHQARIDAFTQELQRLGWAIRRNLQIDTRAGAEDAEHARRYAAELLALSPDVILATGGSVVGPLLQVTRTVPIVFTQTPDPVGAGFVESLARPGRNATGFLLFEYGTSAKWLELLKEMVPSVTRVAVIRDAAIPQGAGQFGAIQSAALPLGIELRPVDLHDRGESERTIEAFARNPNGGLIITASGLANVHRELLITLAAQYRLPAVYFHRLLAVAGGLLSYGPNSIDPHRRAAGYVDRILKGEKPADLPVQAPTKYELVINLKTAKAIGLEVPPSLLVRADEVIE